MAEYTISNHILKKDGTQVAQVPTANRSGTMTPLYIVCHDTASPLSAQGDIDWLAGKGGNRGSSAHFVVARDGKITQLAPCNVVTWHAGASKWNGRSNCNSFTIGIEIDNPGSLSFVNKTTMRGWFGNVTGSEDDFERRATPQHGDHWWMHYTPEQIEAVTGMCLAMVQAYGCKEIITHWLIAPGRKIDTNPLFPLEGLRARVFGTPDQPPPTMDPPPEIPFSPDATILVDGTNLRREPKMGDNVVGPLPLNLRVDVLSQSGEWYLVRTPFGARGYVYRDLIKLD
jgi:N-acetyl-anhydromuramyl-L-alanine amidase AmpD